MMLHNIIYTIRDKLIDKRFINFVMNKSVDHCLLQYTITLLPKLCDVISIGKNSCTKQETQDYAPVNNAVFHCWCNFWGLLIEIQ